MIGELAALGAALSWTVSAVLYKKALLKARPISANIARLVCTCIVLVSCLAIIGKLGILMDLPIYAVILSSVSGLVGLGIGDTLYMTSLELVGVSRAVPLTCTYPLFSLLWATFIRGESITPQLILGTAAIVFGIWLLSQQKETDTPEMRKALIKGMAIAVATAVMWSISITMIDMAVTIPGTGSLDDALAINTIRVTAVAVALLIASPVTDRGLGFLKMQKKSLAALVVGGAVALGLGWFLLTYSFMYVPESRAVPISSTTPLFSTLTGMAMLHEKATWRNAAGSAVIVLGVFLIFLV